MVSSRGSQHLCSLMAAVPGQSRAWALLDMHGMKLLEQSFPPPLVQTETRSLLLLLHVKLDTAACSCFSCIKEEPLGKEWRVPAFRSGLSLSHGSVHH